VEDLAKTLVRNAPFIPPRVNALNAADELGRVVRVEGAKWRVCTSAGECLARRAASCLLDPARDDLVVITRFDDGRSYILAVLERAPSVPLRITLDAGTVVQAEHGSLTVQASKGIRLVSDEAIGMIGRSLHLMADEGTLIIRSLSLFSKLVHVDAGKTKLVGQVITSIAERMHAHGKRAIRG
jgi:Protein of unknown function (DUF3540)